MKALLNNSVSRYASFGKRLLKQPVAWFIGGLLLVYGCSSAVTRGPGSISGTSMLPPLSGPIRTIVVDAGHGGKDPGTSHYGLKEKHLALDIARRLQQELEAVGLKVVMTRSRDRFISLKKRPAVAKAHNAGLFVSVHVNGNRSSKVSGAEVYYPRESTVSSAEWPPSIKSSEVGLWSVTVRKVLWDLVLGRSRTRSRQLASSVCRKLKKSLGVECKAKSARFVVLREAQMPAVLVEVGYLSNKAESQRLKRSDYRRAAARAISSGIVSYIRRQGAQHI